MPRISVSNLTFRYDGSYDNIFENVSFTIDTDWKLGFTGRNGRGKTTFLNLLMGKLEYSGEISSPAEFDYFPFKVDDYSVKSSDVLYSVCPEAPKWAAEAEAFRLGFKEEALSRPFGTLSEGERTKLLLAALFLRENRFLLIDEPTNHLDSEARALTSKYLNSKKGFILVSHDRAFLDGCVDHVLSINKTDIEIQAGNFSSWWQNKQMRDSFEAEKNERLKKDIKRLEIAARRTAKWSDDVEKTKIGTHQADRGAIGHKAAKMMKRSKSIEGRQTRAIEEKSALLKNIETAEALKLSPLAYHRERYASLKNVSVFYGEKQACKDVSFTVNRGERIALSGRNGSGKSSILNLVCGEALEFSGDFEKGSGLLISRVPQDASFLEGSLRELAEAAEIDRALFFAILRKLDFSRAQLEKDARELSLGQKKKVLLARSLCEKAHLYVWDEPLNYVDILSRMQLEELIVGFGPTMLFVEHDASFVDAVATRRIQLG